MTNLFLIEHWDLNKNQRESRIPDFQIVTNGFPIVSLLWLLPKQLNKDNYNTHVKPFEKKHHGHRQTDINSQSQQWHDQWRLD